MWTVSHAPAARFHVQKAKVNDNIDFFFELHQTKQKNLKLHYLFKKIQNYTTFWCV
jgi:hypothetical protein